jgi:NAD(P)H-hydrate repair Nnr-like enzyme with NAD(P)H-hydrate dehydratase domain
MGDVLAGIMGCFVSWCTFATKAITDNKNNNNNNNSNDNKESDHIKSSDNNDNNNDDNMSLIMASVHASCDLTRRVSRQAFIKHK